MCVCVRFIDAKVGKREPTRSGGSASSILLDRRADLSLVGPFGASRVLFGGDDRAISLRKFPHNVRCRDVAAGSGSLTSTPTIYRGNFHPRVRASEIIIRQFRNVLRATVHHFDSDD